MNTITRQKLAQITGQASGQKPVQVKIGCEICQEAFSMLFKRQHQCKRCKRNVCTDCSRDQEKVVSSLTKPSTIQRVCSVCKEEIEYQKQTAYWMKTSWNKSSTISATWAKHLKLPPAEGLKVQFEQDYLVFKTTFQQQKDELLELLEKIKEDLIACFFDDSFFNYSLLEWLYNSQKGLKREDIFNTIKIVIGTFLCAHKDVGYSRDVFLLTVFLLTMAKDHQVYAILVMVYTQVVPTYILPNEQASAMIVQLNQEAVQSTLAEFQANYKVEPNDLQAVRTFMECSLVKYTSCFFINMVSFQVCYSIINQFFEKGSFSVITSYFGKLCRASLKAIRSINVDQDQTQRDIIKFTTLKVLNGVKEHDQQAPPQQTTPIQRSQVKRMTQTQRQMTIEDESKEPVSIQTRYVTNKSLTNLKLKDLVLSPRDAPRVTMFSPTAHSQQGVSFNDGHSNFDTESNAPSQLDNTIMEETNDFMDNLILDQRNQIEQLKQKIRQREEVYAQLQNDNANLNTKLKQLDVDDQQERSVLAKQLNKIREEEEAFARDVKLLLQPYIQQNI